MKHRKLKTCLLIACIPVLVLVFYALLDFKPMPFIARYRLAEKAAMVGPGEILGISTIDLSPGMKNTAYKLLAARTEHGVIVYDGSLMYRKDLGEDVILVAGGGSSYYGMPLVLFDKYPQAVYAKLELEVNHAICAGDEYIGNVIEMEAQREERGYFIFLLDGGEGVETSRVSRFCAGQDVYSEPVPALLRLFDQDGEVVLSTRMEMLSPGIIAHRERGEDYPGTDIGG